MNKRKYINIKMYCLYLVILLINSGQIIINSLMMVHITNLITTSNLNNLKEFFLLFLGLNIFFFIFSYFKLFLRNRLIEHFNISIKREYLNISLSQEFYPQHTGKYISFLTNDLKILEVNYLRSILNISENLIVFFISMVLSLYYNVLLTVVFLIFSLIPGLLPKLFSNKISNQSENTIKTNTEFISLVKDSFGGLKTIKIFSAKNFFLHRLNLKVINVETENKILNNTIDFVSILISSSSRISFLIPLVLGSYLVIDNQISLGILLGMIQNANSIVTPVLQIINSLSLFKTTTKIWERYKEFISLNNYSSTNNKTSYTQGNFKIEVKNFSIVRDNKILFKPINIIINKGDKVIITGPSGVGKTSLLDTLQGINREYSGEIKINDEDIKFLPDDILTGFFSMVQQTPYVFSGTIRDNILLGRNANLSNMVKFSGLENIIKDKGLNFYLEENGMNISGGQKQRIEIARALAKDADVLLLDEYVSSIEKSERKKIYNNIFTRDRTIIEISHIEHDFMTNFYSKRIELIPIDC